jgi:hypothetical protein
VRTRPHTPQQHGWHVEAGRVTRVHEGDAEWGPEGQPHLPSRLEQLDASGGVHDRCRGGAEWQPYHGLRSRFVGLNIKVDLQPVLV